MHPEREKRVRDELKGAKALSLTFKIHFEIGDGTITNTLALNGMPALLFETEGKQVIKCLPLNQLGMGDTRDKAFEALGEDLLEVFTELFNESKLLDLIDEQRKGRAADVYWAAHKRLAKKPPMSKKVKRQVKNVEIETDTVIDPALVQKYLEQNSLTMTV